ncbi:MAG TPA: pentapeptide repeat-containing protein [Leptolyngbyaceae cyanobacterium]
MTGKKSQNRTLSTLFREALREEWRVWLALAILLPTTLLFSNQISVWLEKLALIKVLDSLSKLSILIAAIAFLREIPKWEERATEEAKRRQFEYWKAIDAAKPIEKNVYGRFSSMAFRMALEGLAKEKDTGGRINNVWASGAKLDGIDLEGASLWGCALQGADLSNANLFRTEFHNSDLSRSRIFDVDFRETVLDNVALKYAVYNEGTQFPIGFDPQQAGGYAITPCAMLEGAMLENACLWDSNLENANLQGANLRGATLRGLNSNWKHANLQNANLQKVHAVNIDLRGANLCNANFQEANLDGAKLDGADLQGADLRQATHITVQQIKSARNWEHALYDESFRRELGLLS